MILVALRTWLLANTAITNMVGSAGVFAMRADQASSHPLILLQVISQENETHALGELGLAETRMQIACWAQTYLAAQTLAENVRLRISGYRGPMGNPATQVQNCKLENMLDQDDDTPGLDGRRLYGVICDYIIWHVIPVPVFTNEEE